MATRKKVSPAPASVAVAAAPSTASYQHSEAQALIRPEAGAQTRFKKKKPAATWRYGSSLAPELQWDALNPAREQGEARIAELQAALAGVQATLGEVQAQLAAAQPSQPASELNALLHDAQAKITRLQNEPLRAGRDAAAALKALSRPFLNWAGKAERLSFDVPTLPLFIHERLSTQAILNSIAGHKKVQQGDWIDDFFGHPERSLPEQLMKAYEHPNGWQNRMVLGDSLVVMNSLLHYENMGGQVQMIYIDPPYGVKFGSNFQPFVRKRDVTHNDDEAFTREPEMVKAYRDTWELGLHSYLTYLRDRLLGRDVRAIVSVGMLTEGWDCNTVTHIVGLRPFMSQLLCEQVVGRGLRRASYETEGEGDGERLGEEVAQVFGVPFQVVPFKANKGGVPKPPVKTWRVRALPERAELEIKFPRVEGFVFEPSSEVKVEWNGLRALTIDPTKIPTEVQMKAGLPTNQGRPTLYGPGKLDTASLSAYREEHRLQTRIAEAAKELVKAYMTQSDEATSQVHPALLYPQFVKLVDRFVATKVDAHDPATKADVFLAPYYGWMIERFLAGMQPVEGSCERIRVEQHRGPGTTADVEYATRKEPFAVLKSHVNFVVPDSQWERIAAYSLDTHPAVHSFVKNSGLGFAIPYVHSGQVHDYLPDFLVRLEGEEDRHIIVETKGHDERLEEKKTAAERWVSAVNRDGRYGRWSYLLLRDRAKIAEEITHELDLLARPADSR